MMIGVIEIWICKLWFSLNMDQLSILRLAISVSLNTRHWYSVTIYLTWSRNIERLIDNIDVTSHVATKSQRQFNITWNIYDI